MARGVDRARTREAHHPTLIETVVNVSDARLSGQVRDLLPALAGHHRHVIGPDRRHRPICYACGVQNVHVDAATRLCIDSLGCAKRAANWR